MIPGSRGTTVVTKTKVADAHAAIMRAKIALAWMRGGTMTGRPSTGRSRYRETVRKLIPRKATLGTQVSARPSPATAPEVMGPRIAVKADRRKANGADGDGAEAAAEVVAGAIGRTGRIAHAAPQREATASRRLRNVMTHRAIWIRCRLATARTPWTRILAMRLWLARSRQVPNNQTLSSQSAKADAGADGAGEVAAIGRTVRAPNEVAESTAAEILARAMQIAITPVPATSVCLPTLKRWTMTIWNWTNCR